jgi:hypothetical protein
MLNRPGFHSDKALEAPADGSVFDRHAERHNSHLRDTCNDVTDS